MKQKKGRSLESHLIDSLLDSDNASTGVHSKNRKKKKTPEEPKVSENSGLQSHPDLDLGLADEAKSEPLFNSEPSLIIQQSGSEDETFNLAQTAKPAPEPTSKPVVLREETIRLQNKKSMSGLMQSEEDPSVRVGAGHFVPKQMRGGMSSADATLAQSESLRIAQERIAQLEEEIETVRRDNDQLASAGELLRRRADEMQSIVDQVTRDKQELQKILEEEKSVYKANLIAKEKEISGLRSKVDELELRLENDFKKIRVRERDLEHRLELIKMESSSVVRNKDEIILDLKRKIDQLTVETENYRAKGQDLYKKLDEKQEISRRVVRALRIALSIIEGEEVENNPLKKVD